MDTALPFLKTGTAIRIKVKAIPGAGRTGFRRLEGEEAVFSVAAQPEHGKANKALVRFIASITGCPIGAVSVVRGETSRHKLIELPSQYESSLVNYFLEMENPDGNTGH
jgi:uncharacterized protein YggU (UPF0235/DUF167 family)